MTTLSSDESVKIMNNADFDIKLGHYKRVKDDNNLLKGMLNILKWKLITKSVYELSKRNQLIMKLTNPDLKDVLKV